MIKSILVAAALSLSFAAPALADSLNCADSRLSQQVQFAISDKKDEVELGLQRRGAAMNQCQNRMTSMAKINNMFGANKFERPESKDNARTITR